MSNFQIDNGYVMFEYFNWPALKKYIDDKVKQTAKYVINKKSLSVKALPEFISLFKNSNNFSVEKGRTNHLIKSLGKENMKKLKIQTKIN